MTTKPKTTSSFAARLRALRAEAGLTGAELAKRAGISRQYLYYLEYDRRQPSLETAQRLATALGQQLECWEVTVS